MPDPTGSLLIVDDSHLNRVRLAYMLAQQGYAVTQAENGVQALSLLHAQAFDLVLLDIMMPEIDGAEVLRRMKAHPTLLNIPVIMVSAFDDMACVVECIKLGAEDYLIKPFDPVLLNARISACLEKKRLRDKEQAYLEQVARVTAAAAAVEAGIFEVSSLDEVARRSDDLGQMARVFQQMAQKVFSREQQLRQQVTSLQIEIDRNRLRRQAAEITETSYFKDLQQQVQSLRAEISPDQHPEGDPAGE